jgi:hypothetical protein
MLPKGLSASQITKILVDNPRATYRRLKLGTPAAP